MCMRYKLQCHQHDIICMRYPHWDTNCNLYEIPLSYGKSFLGGHEWKNVYIICKYLVDTISQNRRSRVTVRFSIAQGYLIRFSIIKPSLTCVWDTNCNAINRNRHNKHSNRKKQQLNFLSSRVQLLPICRIPLRPSIKHLTSTTILIATIKSTTTI